MATTTKQRFSFESEIHELSAELDSISLISSSSTSFNSASELDGTATGTRTPTYTNLTSAPSESDATEYSSHADYNSAIHEKLRLNIETLSRLEGETGSQPIPRSLARPSGPPSPQRSTVPVSEDDIDWDAPPSYQMLGNEQRNVSTALLDNGRISMLFRGHGRDFTTLPSLPVYEPSAERARSFAAHSYPLLNIVIQVVGSRGDVQPFLALGQELQLVGHRVRLATHPTFEPFIREAGLEFFSIGGDPSDLMAYMVKNPGIIPKFESIRAGDIARKRKMISEILQGCWNSCIQPDAVSGDPFVAEAIIANPPSFAHIHCAQALSIPVHLMFTMPWTATRVFPHPLANVQLTDTDAKTTNFLSYGLVDMMTWQGLGDVINHWRRKTLNLDSLPSLAGANLASYLKVPFTYCWSPALIPKPFDWPSHIDVCGFFFRNPPSHTPTPELEAFLKAGPPPIYIGFGSIVMNNSHEITRIILDAVRQCGVRAIVSEGWSKLGDGVTENHPDVIFIGDCPHEWLFKQVSAVVHHGGAGTTACGLLNGRPTAIVPFFGDQPFWGTMVAAAGAGPRPIDHKSLSVTTLAKTIEFLLHPSAMAAASRVATKMQHENGVKEAVKSFHRNLPVETLNCDLLPRYPATWCWKRGKRTLKLSHKAASMLADNKKIEASSLKMYKTKPIYIENRRWEPITGTTSAFIESIYNVGGAMSSENPLKEYRKVKTMEREKALSITSSTADDNSSIRTIRSMNNLPNDGSVALSSASDSGNSVYGNTSSARSIRGPSANKAAANSVGRGFGKVGMALTKGAIDLPRAVADGLHNVPALYGEKVRNYGEIRGWKSGALVGAKSLSYGFYDGYIGFFSQPYKGARDEGALGLLKGVVKGSMGLLTQPAHAMFGIVAYPALGLYKQINVHNLNATQVEVLLALKEYGIWYVQRGEMERAEVVRVLRVFDDQWLRVRE